MPAGTTVYLYTDATKDTQVEVPDVAGKPADQARQMLQAAGLNVQFSGLPDGTVTGQSESAGAKVPMGKIVVLDTADETVSE